WRASSWSLRRMGTGGMVLEVLPDEDRKKAGLGEQEMALRAKYVAKTGGPHGAADRAGFRTGDVGIAFDERTDLRRETDVLAYAVNQHKVGDRLPVTVLRDGKKVTLTLPVQE